MPEFGNTRELGLYVLTPTTFSGRDSPSGMSCRSPLRQKSGGFMSPNEPDLTRRVFHTDGVSRRLEEWQPFPRRAVRKEKVLCDEQMCGFGASHSVLDYGISERAGESPGSGLWAPSGAFHVERVPSLQEYS